MASYDDSESDDDNFNPAPADVSDDENMDDAPPSGGGGRKGTSSPAARHDDDDDDDRPAKPASNRPFKSVADEDEDEDAEEEEEEADQRNDDEEDEDEEDEDDDIQHVSCQSIPSLPPPLDALELGFRYCRAS
jgi:transcription elongation factor SPT5